MCCLRVPWLEPPSSAAAMQAGPYTGTKDIGSVGHSGLDIIEAYIKVADLIDTIEQALEEAREVCDSIGSCAPGLGTYALKSPDVPPGAFSAQ